MKIFLLLNIHKLALMPQYSIQIFYLVGVGDDPSESGLIGLKAINLVQNSLRQALLYLTNKSSSKCGNWCDGKA